MSAFDASGDGLICRRLHVHRALKQHALPVVCTAQSLSALTPLGDMPAAGCMSCFYIACLAYCMYALVEGPKPYTLHPSSLQEAVCMLCSCKACFASVSTTKPLWRHACRRLDARHATCKACWCPSSLCHASGLFSCNCQVHYPLSTQVSCPQLH